MKFTNTQKGPRGINTKKGPVHLEPGQTSEDVEVSAPDLEVARATGWFDIEGDGRAAKADDKKA